MIDWATDNKVPTNYFEVERSSDGINFKTIALVFGRIRNKQVVTVMNVLISKV